MEDKHKEYIELEMKKADVNVEIILRELEIKKLCEITMELKEFVLGKGKSLAFDATAFKNQHPKLLRTRNIILHPNQALQ